MSFEPVSKVARPVADRPAISIGARKRGKNGRLTPYVMLTAEASLALFGTDTGLSLSLEIGSGDHEGWIRLTPSEDGQISLRPAGKIAKDLIAESRLIPHDGKSKLRRSAAEFEIDGGLMIRLPWSKKKKAKEL